MKNTPMREPIDVETLERILSEVAHQILEHGIGSMGEFGQWSRTSISVELRPDRVHEVLQAGACRVGVAGSGLTPVGDLARYIDHTLLRPDATATEIDRLCDEALRHGFATVCVNGVWVKRCAEILAGSGVHVCSVVGFPLGAAVSEVKAYEARRAIEDGACEIDMVMNIGALKSGDGDLVLRDIVAVLEVCHKLGARLKVILETALLDESEKVRACELARLAGADFVKTSTGFSRAGATPADVALMRRVVGPTMGVKAAGGVRDEKEARAMLEAGATRLGASASVALVHGVRAGARD